MNIIDHYTELVHKVDNFSAQVIQRYGDHLVCRHGCTDCCGHDITVFPLEYHVLCLTYGKLPANRKARAHDIFVDRSVTGSCALLHQGGCLLYEARPIICRTHGLPLVIREQGKERRDCCPKNFSRLSLERIPDTDVLQLETLNTMLIALNNAFCAQHRIDPAKRLPLRELVARRSQCC